jgi:hypothetical protein
MNLSLGSRSHIIRNSSYTVVSNSQMLTTVGVICLTSECFNATRAYLPKL